MSFADFESQIDELLALESIYDQTCFRTSRPIEGLTAEQVWLSFNYQAAYWALVISDLSLLLCKVILRAKQTIIM